MKINAISFFFSVGFLLLNSSFSKAGSILQNNIPYAVQGILATDQIIDPSNSDTQTDVRVATAKNGWVFAAYIRSNGTASAGIKVKRSKDNGQSWKNVCNITLANARFISGLDIIVCGNDSASLVLYLMSVEHNLSIGKYTVFIKKYDGNTGALLANSYTEPNSFSYPILDCALTTDFNNPSIVSNPYSIGALFSLRSNPYDSLIFVYSIDGGNTFNRQLIDTTDAFFNKVAIAYGKSLSQPNGKYFVAYEKKAGANTQIGHIRTAHTTDFPGSPFTIPFEVDTLVGSTTNVCSYPSIACQINSTDNDSGDITTVLMLERDFNGQGYNHDVLGFVNKNTQSNFWERFNVLNGSSSNGKQPVVMYDYAKNFFLATYWDSVTGKLALTYKDINFTNPNTWPNLISQYNDSTANIEDAKPHLSINPTNGRTHMVWISGGKNVEGVAYYDTNASIVGLEETDDESDKLMCYPNPANTACKLQFMLSEPNYIQLVISDLSGRNILVNDMQFFEKGKNQLLINTASLMNGYYLITLRSSIHSITNKLIISHP
jgi:Secretion system C-terminal sorting domain